MASDEEPEIDVRSLDEVHDLVRDFGEKLNVQVRVLGVDRVSHAQAMQQRLEDMMDSNGWKVQYTVWLERVRRLSVMLESAALHLENLKVEIEAGTVTDGTLMLFAQDVRELEFDPLYEVRAELGVIAKLLGSLLVAARVLRGIPPQMVAKAWGDHRNNLGLRRAASLLQQLMEFPLVYEAAKPRDVYKIVENFAFQPDISRLISVLNSRPTLNNDIFLFELISNSSNALDKRSQSNRLSGDAQTELFIDIFVDKAKKSLRIKDCGIGMTKSDLVHYLGRNARSGTNQFIAAFEADADVSMIGHFGVGFYSVFLVAKRIEVCSKHKDDTQYKWESESCQKFTVKADYSGTIHRGGTEITLYLKDDQLEFLEEDRLKHLIVQHAKVFSYPVSLNFIERTEKDIDYDVKHLLKTFDDSLAEHNWNAFFPIKPYAETTKDKKMEVRKNRLSLSMKPDPIWLRNPEDITNEEYAAFYKSLTKDSEGHLAVKHFSVEGPVNFNCILFIPKRTSFDLCDTGTKLEYIRLYVQNVFVMDNNHELIPERLSFVKGIVDTDDYPLDSTPEALCQNKKFNFIRHNLANRCIELFSEMAENQEEYKLFYEAFSDNIKLCLREDCSNKKIAELLRYHSTESGDELTSLKDYVTRMKEGQSDIYYIVGESKKAVENSPFLETLKTMGYEVLFMVDTIDTFIMDQLNEFEGKNFQSANQESVKKMKLG